MLVGEVDELGLKIPPQIILVSRALLCFMVTLLFDSLEETVHVCIVSVDFLEFDLLCSGSFVLRLTEYVNVLISVLLEFGHHVSLELLAEALQVVKLLV